MKGIDEVIPLYHDIENKEEWYCDRLECSGFKVNLCKIENFEYTYPSVQNYRGKNNIQIPPL